MLNFSRRHNLRNLPHFAALRHKDYRNTWFANMFSGAAMWAFIVATAWLVLERSALSSWVGIITFASMIPFLLVSPVGGLMADRLDRRNLALVTFVGSSLTVAALVALVATSMVQLWHVAILAFVGGTFRSIQEPAIQALVPNQVPRADLLNAITLNSATRHGARFIGAGLGALLQQAGGVGVVGVLVLSSVFYLLGGIQMARVHTVSRGEISPKYGVARSMIEGLVHIYTRRTIALFIILVAFHCALVMSFESILPLLSKEQLGATDLSILGYLVMGFGVGSIIGTILLAGIRSEPIKGQFLFWTGLASGITPVMLAVSGNLPLAIFSSVAMGAAQATFMALTNTYVQILAPDRLRGRISSLYTLHAGGIMAFSNLGYGFLADVFSAPPIFLITGVVFLLIVGSLSLGQTTLRGIYRTGEVTAV